jgi:hypothetical protein
VSWFYYFLQSQILKYIIVSKFALKSSFSKVSYTIGELAFAVCPPICCEQHTIKAGFVMCPAHAHGKRQAHGIPSLCRVLHTVNTKHTVNSNLCRERHTVKTGHTAKANPTLTPTSSRQCLPLGTRQSLDLPCAWGWLTANTNFVVCHGCSTRQTICLFSDFTLQIFSSLHTHHL